MAIDIFDLSARISCDTSEYNNALDDASSKSGSFGKKLSAGLSGAAKTAGVAIAAVGTATAAVSKAFINSASDVAQYGDNIDKMSQKIGISAEAYQEWDFIAQHSGTSMESLKASFKTLSNAAQDGKDSFEKLGISLEDAASMSTEDLFSAVVSGLQDMEEGTERTAIASELLGRGAIELGALLNTSAEDTEAMRQQVHELGGVMSNEAVKSAAQYQDSLQNMQTALAGLKNNIMSEFLPSMSAVMDGLGKVFSGDISGLDDIDKGIDDLINNLSNSIPKIMEVGGKLITSLGKAIINNLPKIVKSAVPIILELNKALIENLPTIIKAGIEIILSIAEGIAQSLPELIPAIVETIIMIVETLLDNIDLLIDAVIQLMIGITEGIINALPVLIEKLPEILIKIGEALIENIPLLLEAIWNCLKMIAEAIWGKLGEFYSSSKEWFSNLISGIGDWLSELPEKMAYWAGEAIGKTLKFFIELPGKVKEKLDQVWPKIKEWGSNLGKEASEAGKKFKDNLTTTLQELPGKIKDIGKNIIEKLKEGIQEKWESFKEWFSNLGQNLIDGFLGVFSKGDGESGAASNTTTKNAKSTAAAIQASTAAVNSVNTSSGMSRTQASAVQVNVSLEGDTKNLFKVITNETQKTTRSTGFNPLLSY